MGPPPTTLLAAGQADSKMDPLFRNPSQPALVSFGFHSIDPPAAVYIQRDDVLVLEAFTQTATNSVTLFARLLIPVAQKPRQPDAPPLVPGDPQALVGPGYIQPIQRLLPLP